MDFGHRLKELRQNARLTQKQLAQRVGVSKSVISYYELGERAPSPDVLIRFSRIFGISTDELLGIGRHSALDTEGLTKDDIDLLLAVIRHLKDKNGITAGK